jgi:hypothetical protein
LVVVVGVDADTSSDPAEITPASGLFPSSAIFAITDHHLYISNPIPNTTSPTSAPGSATKALDRDVNDNITNGATGLKVTTTGPASGTITLTATLTFTFTGGTSPARTGGYCYDTC